MREGRQSRQSRSVSACDKSTYSLSNWQSFAHLLQIYWTLRYNFSTSFLFINNPIFFLSFFFFLIINLSRGRIWRVRGDSWRIRSNKMQKFEKKVFIILKFQVPFTSFESSRDFVELTWILNVVFFDYTSIINKLNKMRINNIKIASKSNVYWVYVYTYIYIYIYRYKCIHIWFRNKIRFFNIRSIF